MMRPALSQTPRHAVREIFFVMIPHSGRFPPACCFTMSTV